MPPLLVFGRGQALVITGGRVDGLAFSFWGGDGLSVGGQVSAGRAGRTTYGTTNLGIQCSGLPTVL
jgi:hypothetical protein